LGKINILYSGLVVGGHKISNKVFSRKSGAWQAGQKCQQQTRNVLCVGRAGAVVKVLKNHNFLAINKLAQQKYDFVVVKK
jgi:hypothetical protein